MFWTMGLCFAILAFSDSTGYWPWLIYMPIILCTLRVIWLAHRNSRFDKSAEMC